MAKRHPAADKMLGSNDVTSKGEMPEQDEESGEAELSPEEEQARLAAIVAQAIRRRYGAGRVIGEPNPGPSVTPEEIAKRKDAWDEG